MNDVSITYKFSGHLNSNLFVRASNKASVTHVWSSHLVPIVNQHFSESTLHDIKGSRSWDECLKQLLKIGAVYLDQKRMTGDFEMDANNVVRFHLLPRRYDPNLLDVRRDIIFQNEDFLVVNKPALLPVHPTLDNTVENLLSLLQQQLKSPIYGLHRLDLETTGLILFAKTESAMMHFQKLFEGREIKKIYKAVVFGSNSRLGYYRHWMEKNPRSPKKISSTELPNYMPIELNILNQMPFALDARATILDIELLTGKTHQIRSQMAHIGFPLIGDSMYGGPDFENEKFNHFLLHANELQFIDSRGVERSFHVKPSWL
tara:strand:- start:43147 stop:44097 length:951 start_codon:yes stop_codon:yes gene_type:complete